MKIGTDSILLGCFCDPADAQTILDIGAGTGLLALMMAQKSSAMIEAVEIDLAAYEEASGNIRSSKWVERIHLFHTPVQQFASSKLYDLIITNPPYYKHGSSFSIEEEQRSKARHDKELPFEELCEEVSKRLNASGTFWLILPVQEATLFKEIAQHQSLYLQQEVLVKPKESKSHNRIIMCFGKNKTALEQKTFTIYHDDGSATEEYYLLTKDFLLWKAK